MKPNGLVRVVSVLVLASAVLTAQVARKNDVPLKNWTTPLYWQPNQGERDAPRGAAPQLQFSANAVSTTALTFVAITPCRLVDTRGAGGGFNGIAPFSGPSIASGGTLTIPVQSTTEASADTTPAPCGVIPSIAQAYSLNLTVVPHAAGAVDYISMWPSGSAQPFVATLDDPQGAIVSNAAIVPAGTPTGGISVFNAGPAITDVIIDMNGFFAAPSDVSFNTAIGTGTLASNTSGTDNTASGYFALQNNTTGSFNTANGAEALQYNTTGSNNTADGYFALWFTTTGSDNTANGSNALYFNTTGGNNTAIGFQALYSNTTSSGNTATGSNSLMNNSTGNQNTADGFMTLASNTSGFNNSAIGNATMQNNTTGFKNTAIGNIALTNNTTGSQNIATGGSALTANTTGSSNTADGFAALVGNTTGSNNIAIGLLAAQNVAGANSNNIDIGNLGVAGDGAAANSGVIRIGTVGTQTTAFIAGISGATPGTPNAFVCVDANGQLGTSGCTGGAPSSQRFKEQIADMGDSSSKLFQLRPVTFLYKPQYDDGSHSLQYGLIAEEVAKLYPEMVGYDKDGQPSSVKYQLLAPMLLNEVQKLEERLAALEALLSSQASRPAGNH